MVTPTSRSCCAVVTSTSRWPGGFTDRGIIDNQDYCAVVIPMSRWLGGFTDRGITGNREE